MLLRRFIILELINFRMEFKLPLLKIISLINNLIVHRVLLAYLINRSCAVCKLLNLYITGGLLCIELTLVLINLGNAGLRHINKKLFGLGLKLQGVLFPRVQVLYSLLLYVVLIAICSVHYIPLLLKLHIISRMEF